MDDVYEILKKRLGEKKLQNRLIRQVNHSSDIISYEHINIENFSVIFRLGRYLLKAFNSYDSGYRNALDIQINHNQIVLRKLPKEFRNYKILHLSDLHIDGNPLLLQNLADKLQNLDYDICVLTGDFRYRTSGELQPVINSMEKLLPYINKGKDGILAVLGNHDFIEIVPLLEKLGIEFLINEHKIIYQQKTPLCFVGLDDQHFYRNADINEALPQHHNNLCKILLIHSPEYISQANSKMVDLYLCGHTHGGQICWPDGKPIFMNARAKNIFCRGNWHYEEMKGYTSNGCGCSGMNIRFNCPPEITIHHLIPNNSVD